MARSRTDPDETMPRVIPYGAPYGPGRGPVRARTGPRTESWLVRKAVMQESKIRPAFDAKYCVFGWLAGRSEAAGRQDAYAYGRRTH